MRIPFAAYADDCTVRGEFELEPEADRLSDFLARTAELRVNEVSLRALDDGRLVEADAAAVLLGDLCAVIGAGPRGRLEARVWTRQYPVRVRVGPYVVTGYLHAPPTIDPLKAADRRSIVPLTSSVVEYEIGGQLAREPAEAVLLNRLKIATIEPVAGAEIGAPPGPGSEG